jgi:hypothetical protein
MRQRLANKGRRGVDRTRAWLSRPVHDPTRGWRGATGENGRELRLIAFTDCTFRAMPLAHGTHNPTGYAELLAQRLEQRGVALRARNVFVLRTDDLPRAPDELVRWNDLGGDPDQVLVHTGAMCGMRTVLGMSAELQGMRDRIAGKLGPHAVTAYRRLWPLARPFSRAAIAPQDPERLAEFAALVARVWPRARLLVMPPIMPSEHAPWSFSITERTADEVRAVCEREGIALVDPSPSILALPTETARCTNGYNLTWTGHENVADLLEPRLLELLDREAPAVRQGSIS